MNWLHFMARACPAVALAAVLAVAGPSYARGGGGGHGGGGHGGGFHGGGFHGGGYGYRGFGGYGYRGYGWGGGYYPYYYGLGYGYPYYGNSYSSYPYYPYYNYPAAGYTGGYQSYYPVTTTPAQAPNSVRLNIWVPVANAKVWIDNTLTQQAGTYRQFESPALTPGSNYSYTVRAQWTQDGKPVERSQTVSFHAGEQVNVNLAQGAATAG